jgi:hypothetical protein
MLRLPTLSPQPRSDVLGGSGYGHPHRFAHPPGLSKLADVCVRTNRPRNAPVYAWRGNGWVWFPSVSCSELIVHVLATPQTSSAYYKGWSLMVIDGTVCSENKPSN